MKLTLFKKLLFSFLVVLLLLSTISITAITNMGNMGKKSKQTTEIGLTNVILLGNLNHNLIELDDLMLRIQLNLEDQRAQEGLGMDAESQTDKATRLFNEIQGKVKKVDGIAFTEKDAGLIKYFAQNWNAYAEKFPAILSGVQKRGPEGMDLIRQGNVFLSSCSAIVSMLSENNQGYANEWAAELTDSYESGVAWVIALSLIAIAAGLAVSFLIARHVSKPIQEMSSIAKRVSSGDLSVNNSILTRQDEIGELSGAFGQMTDHMRQMILKINEHAQLVAASADQLNISSDEMQISSRQIAETVKDVADGANKQTLSMEETSRSMEEVGAGIGRLAENAASISETVESSRQQAENGGNSIQITVQQMSSISESVHQTDLVIKMLDHKSQQIGSILQAIQDIAQQTNLLALNAAIEAARAHEHGAGFAVVAAEVRKLAEQSSSSSGEIAQLLNEIQTSIHESGESMSKVKDEVQTGIEMVRETELNFDHIRQSTTEIASQIQEMAATSEEMSAGAQQITAAVQQVTAIAHKSSTASQNVALTASNQLKTTGEVQSSVKSLSEMTEELHRLLSQFKVS
ncbi:methyl-accepting chemotaxis protein [Paenibacillus radicis (ex Xue et al. 2023)]|uniref:Methyl-accepting chemotaxis protein n=1 Tax=Paenibacillus radicis (ex Xue et al. 2023) TaxID=2972489 RepID=A0ABT1YJS3_9BACL|nr:HAMP domain-containing methyl-accepting chemotaxis protein [Paenibacillus radicis (ex Xue et al. 2023)]MCR8632235.1 methyl-accepting chemotaxis protein [Paenibacillus radicis (ex Xue et al. 2023)]